MTFADVTPVRCEGPRLMFVVHRLAHGGAEQQVAALAISFADRGRDIAVVAADGAEQSITDRMREARVHVIDLKSWGLRGTVPKLAAAIRRWNPEIVHAHGFRPNIAARLAGPLTRGFLLVCTTHNLGESQYPFKTPHWQLRYRLTDPMSALTTNVCRAGLENYVAAGAIPPSKGAVVPNGIDVERFQPDQAARTRLREELRLADSPTLIAVGRIAAGKGYETLLEAFGGIDRESKAALLLVGSGPDERAIKDQAASLNLGDRVRFLGPRDDIPDLLNAADAYVMASWSEALPLVLLEASSVGLPVVATSVGGNSDIVSDGVTGLLVPPKSAGALRRAIESLLAMPDAERRCMGVAGRAHTVAEFSLDHVVDRWDSIYGELIERRGPWIFRKGTKR